MQFKPVSVPRPHRFQDVTDAADSRFVIHDMSIASSLVPTLHIVEALGSAATLAQSGNKRVIVKIQFRAAGFWNSNPFELRRAKRIAQFIGPAKQTPTRLRFGQAWSKGQGTRARRIWRLFCVGLVADLLAARFLGWLAIEISPKCYCANPLALSRRFLD